MSRSVWTNPNDNTNIMPAGVERTWLGGWTALEDNASKNEQSKFSGKENYTVA